MQFPTKWLTDLLKEYPALAVAEQRLKLHEEEFARLKEDRDRLEGENEQLRRENASLRAKLPTESESSFIEEAGVLWKVRPGRPVEAIAYCPDCRKALAAFPPGSNEMLLCSKCHFTAPIRPREVTRYAQEITRLRDEALS